MALAIATALVAAAARPCTFVSGHGYQWRNRPMSMLSTVNVTVTNKRPARHLGIATT
ncbi:MAG TPA: hypothetical protein VMS14_09045 [Ilumatobacteraceae bacterium]|nr:hypothetical protein [Ilumatobacteraceae bacterium]